MMTYKHVGYNKKKWYYNPRQITNIFIQQEQKKERAATLPQA
jgi:hypothetical protein